MKIALAGNPNCGKTTMFNSLTGSSQYVGNWPGVTVEKKEGSCKKDITVVDLPGIYSLSPYTPEEVVTRDYLITERPDAVINIVDASNSERSLYLTTQLLEMGLPVVIAMNMIDVADKRGDQIDIPRLEKELSCRVVRTSALKGTGLDGLVDGAISAARERRAVKIPIFSPAVERAIMTAQTLIQDRADRDRLRWYAVKLIERDEKVMDRLGLDEYTRLELEAVASGLESRFGDEIESIIANQRYEYITGVTRACVHRKNRTNMTPSDKIDLIVTNRALALPIFALIMWGVYYVSVTWLGANLTEWMNRTVFAGVVQPFVRSLLASVGAAPWMQGLVVDGIIGGVGSVLSFVPQVMILFLFLSILEDCGYISRIAFIMDRLFCKIGLSGKSFIPLLISTGCGVPGILASRTIESEKDRKITIIVTTFVPCGAKLPIIALIAGSMFRDAVWIAPSVYFLGIALVAVSGIILKKTKLFEGQASPFVMELPQYHLPDLKSVIIHVWERSKAFIVKAGTVILIASSVIWFLSNFGIVSDGLRMVSRRQSFLASTGSFIAPIFKPLGFGTWEAVVSTLTGFVAKENLVGTFGVLFGLSGAALMDRVAEMFVTPAAAYSFLMFNMICAPCAAAVGAIKREMGGWKWTLIAIGYQTALAYAVSFIIYNIGGVLTGTADFGPWTVIAALLIGIFVWLMVRNPKDRGS